MALTSWLAAHFVYAAAGTHAAADDDEENSSNARQAQDHRQWRVRETVAEETTENTHKKQLLKTIM